MLVEESDDDPVVDEELVIATLSPKLMDVLDDLAHFYRRRR